MKRCITALAVSLTVWLATAAAAYAGGGGGSLPQPVGAAISQSNQQTSSCGAGSSNLSSCNNTAQNQNSGNATSGGGLMVTTVAAPLTPPPPPGGGTATISQSNQQASTCRAWETNDGSCNNSAQNQNSGNATSGGAALNKLSTQLGPPQSQENGTAAITQTNQQTSSCYAGSYNKDSCNNTAQNQNSGNATAGGLVNPAVVRTTSLPGPAGGGGSAVISQSNRQSSICKAHDSNEDSCNNAAQNQNSGNAESGGGPVYATLTGPSGPPQGGSPGGALISQSNTQSATCKAGSSNVDSCNNSAQNANTGNAESLGGGGPSMKPFGKESGPNGGGATISQTNTQSSSCTAWDSNEKSCNNTAQNANTGDAESYGGGPSGKPDYGKPGYKDGNCAEPKKDGYEQKHESYGKQGECESPPPPCDEKKQSYEKQGECESPPPPCEKKKESYEKQGQCESPPPPCDEKKGGSYDKKYEKPKGDCHPKPPCDDHKQPPHDKQPPAPPKQQPTGIQQTNTQQSSCWAKDSNIGSCNNTAQNANTGNVTVSEGGQTVSWSGAAIQQGNQQSSSCTAGSDNMGSCNNTAQNANTGDVTVGDLKD